jgi:uncharacterized LabA/DUF88 family protein
MKSNKKVAVLIDAENISSKHAERIMKDASDYGEIVIKRIFADWTNEAVKTWKNQVLRFSLVPEHQFNFVKGKDSSDMSLIINALLILFEKDIDIFCLASSDSDFTRLVQELRERDKLVVGFGETNKTNKAFVNAFGEFIYLDDNIQKALKESAGQRQKPGKQSNIKQVVKPKGKIKIDEEKIEVLIEIIEMLIEQNGKALYAQISNEMKKKYSDFLPKNYGVTSMKKLMQALVESKLKDYRVHIDSDKVTMSLIYKK